MMRLIKGAISIFCFLLATISFAQQNHQGEFTARYNKLLTHLSKENWAKSERVSMRLLAELEAADTMLTQQMVLRYIYLYSVAGLLGSKKISQEKALAKVKFLQSKEMMMPAHPFNSKCYINCTHLSDDDSNTFFTTVNNAAGTQIFGFEYVHIKGGIRESKAQLEGKLIRLRGQLNEISIEGNLFPRFKLKFIKGDYLVEVRQELKNKR